MTKNIKQNNLRKYQYIKSEHRLLDQHYKSDFNLLHSLITTCYKINNYFNQNNYEAAKSQLNYLTNITFKEFNLIYTNSSVLNTLISNRAKIINENCINIKATIEYNDFNFIDYNDQIDLFGLVLDFAISETINTKFCKDIFINSTIKANQLLLHFQYVDNKNNKLQNDLISSIKCITKKYKTNITISNLTYQMVSLIIVFPKFH